MGLILAGGQNRRFDHEPKGAYTWQEKSLFEHVEESLVEVTSEIFVSVHDTRPPGVSAELPIIPDYYEERLGPMNGIYSALVELEEPLLVVPWDMPVVSRNLLEILTNDYHRQRHGPLCFRYHGSVYPFPGIYSPRARRALKQSLKEKKLSMTCWLQSQYSRFLDLEEFPEINRPGEELQNINTPDDLENLSE